MHLETIIAAAITGVLASLVTAFVNKSTADKKNAIENITQERKTWRDDLRGATIALRRYFENKDRFCIKGDTTDGKENCGIVFHSAAEAKAFFEVRLNLSDKEDCKLMAILDMLAHKDAAATYELSLQWKDYRFWGDGEKISVMKLLAYFEEGMSHNLKYDWERAKTEVQSNGLMRYFIFFVALLVTSTLFSSTLLFELRFQKITVGGWLYFISLFALIVISIVCVIKYIVRLLAVFQDKYLFGKNKFTAAQLVSEVFGTVSRRKIEPMQFSKKWSLCVFLLLGLGIIPTILIVSTAVILVAYGLFPTSIVSSLIETINLGSKM